MLFANTNITIPVKLIVAFIVELHIFLSYQIIHSNAIIYNRKNGTRCNGSFRDMNIIASHRAEV